VNGQTFASDDPVVAFLRAGFLSSPLFCELARDTEQETYPESQAKRHHLVPRFLLANFAQSVDGRERLMQLDVHTGSNVWAAPDGAASRSRFYRLTDDDGTTHQRVEHYLSRVESHAATAIRHLCAGPASLSAADRATIAMFLALQEGRTIAGLEQLSNLADLTLQTMQASHCADPVAFEDTYRRAIGPVHPEQVEQARKEMLAALAENRVKLANPKEVALDLLLQHSVTSSQYIYQLQWHLLEAVDGRFVTSDRGLAMYDPTPAFPWSGHAIMSSPNAQTTIPLGPTQCLLLRPPGPVLTAGVPVHRIDARKVMEINLRTYGFASDYIFADTQQTATNVHREAKARPKAVERPRRSHQIVLIDAEAGDDRLANEHEKRGWPPRLVVAGHAHDYVVLAPDDRPIERSVDLATVGKQRAMRRLGTSEIYESTVAIDPTRLAGS
jgi:hypothetical protein